MSPLIPDACFWLCAELQLWGVNGNGVSVSEQKRRADHGSSEAVFSTSQPLLEEEF